MYEFVLFVCFNKHFTQLCDRPESPLRASSSCRRETAGVLVCVIYSDPPICFAPQLCS